MLETSEKTVVQQDDNTMKEEKTEDWQREDSRTEHLDDAKRCRHCGEDAVVPIKDKQFESIHRRGNPYRQTCLSCEKHICMCSREFWEGHPDRFVMDSEIADATPVFDCPECGELVEGYPDECPLCEAEYEW